MNDIHGLKQIVAGLYLLESPGGGRFPHSHSFVIRGDTDVLIDVGCGIERLRELRTRWVPDLVVVSHAHPDHCAGLWLFEDSRIVSPVERSDIFWRLDEQSIRLAGPDNAEYWKNYVTANLGARGAAADSHFESGQVLDLGTIRLECVHTPGHTDDHYVLFEPNHGIALTFDIDLTSFGPWYGHDESDIELFLESIQKVADLRPAVLVSSHKGIITDDVQGRLQRYAEVIHQRDARILAKLDQPTTVDDLVQTSPIHGGYPYAPDLLRYWESNMITKHLARLAAAGRVLEDRGSWCST
jgi:glyoxylase-like metal-dependent hydrolase (beta-lactamase superfamily II)